MGRMTPGSADRQQRHSRSSYDLAVRHWWAGAWVQKGHVIADAESAHEMLSLPCTIMVRNISKGRACGRSSGGRLTLHASGVLRFRDTVRAVREAARLQGDGGVCGRRETAEGGDCTGNSHLQFGDALRLVNDIFAAHCPLLAV